MRRILAVVAAAAALGATVMAPAAFAHGRDATGGSTNFCGFQNSLQVETGVSAVDNAYPYQGRKSYEIPVGPGYHVDDRDYIGWGGFTSLPTRAVDRAKTGGVGWGAWDHDHSAGLWIYEESGVERGLQRGGRGAFNSNPALGGAWETYVAPDADPCVQPNADRVVF
ncbi:MAG: hypothetical protein ACR2H3_03010 [Acidimicrobiales bacterium]